MNYLHIIPITLKDIDEYMFDGNRNLATILFHYAVEILH